MTLIWKTYIPIKNRNIPRKYITIIFFTKSKKNKKNSKYFQKCQNFKKIIAFHSKSNFCKKLKKYFFRFSTKLYIKKYTKNKKISEFFFILRFWKHSQLMRDSVPYKICTSNAYTVYRPQLMVLSWFRLCLTVRTPYVRSILLLEIKLKICCKVYSLYGYM